MPGEHERDDDEGAGEVAEPPRAPDARQLAGVDHAAERQRQRPDRRARRRRSRDRQAEPREPAKRRQGLCLPHQACDQIRADEGLEHVPCRLPERRSEGERGVVVREQVSQEDAGPVPQACEAEAGDRHADGQPHDRRDGAGEPELVAEPGNAVVRGREGTDPGQIPDRRDVDERKAPTAIEGSADRFGTLHGCRSDRHEPPPGLRSRVTRTSLLPSDPGASLSQYQRKSPQQDDRHTARVASVCGA